MRHEVIIKRASRDCNRLSVEVEDLLLGRLLANVGLRGNDILIKPNLLKANDPSCVTSPEMILAVARALSQTGANVAVADSPAFGSAIQVIRGLGILDELQALGVEVMNLGDAHMLPLDEGVVVGVSRTALEASIIVNVPRLKAHTQMGVTGAVKNLFGTVVGFRKALYHLLYGGDRERFSRMLLNLIDKLPRCITILDAISVMHVTGPSGGEPLDMNFIAGANAPVPLDTAVYELLGARPQDVPLWRVARKMGISGARIEEIDFPCLTPSDIHEGSLFRLPQALEPLRFSPVRFIKGRTKSLLRRLSH